MTTTAEAPAHHPVRVAVLGGGAAALSTAFWLTAPEMGKRFRVSVYAPGWRLGGKCASGRNEAEGQRIEEHGLHLLMGCYHHVFRTLRACYAQWPLPANHPFRHPGGHGNWEAAFKPHFAITLQQPLPSGTGTRWAPWHFDAASRAGKPGDALPGARPASQPCPIDVTPPSPLDVLLRELAGWTRMHVADFLPGAWHEGLDVERSMVALEQTLEELPSPEALQALEADLGKIMGRIQAHGLELANIAGMKALVREAKPSVCPGDCMAALFELAMGIANGAVADGLVVGGDAALARLNAYDFREWLMTRGGVRRETASSAPIRALYDLAFAYRGGDGASLDKGSMAAGVTLRFALEATLGYRGAPLWKMQAGMGDVVFTPLYQVLKARGVDFHFFHRVTSVEPRDGQVATVRLARQARVAREPYEPLVPVKGLECWPSQPKWGSLVDEAAYDRRSVDFESAADRSRTGPDVVLEAGKDFDAVVIAFPPDVIRQAAPQLSAADWDAMLAHARSVATGAFQLWMKDDLPTLGWTLGSTVLTAYAPPFDSWADMTDLVPREDWGAHDAPVSIHYFCGSVQDAVAADPRAAADAWLAQSIRGLWPRVAPAPPAAGRIRSAYHRVNHEGSDRYVQTPKGSVRHRMPSDEPVFVNLYIAGDWTLTRFSGGCVEAAFESGILAAKGICERY